MHLLHSCWLSERGLREFFVWECVCCLCKACFHREFNVGMVCSRRLGELWQCVCLTFWVLCTHVHVLTPCSPQHVNFFYTLRQNVCINMRVQMWEFVSIVVCLFWRIISCPSNLDTHTYFHLSCRQTLHLRSWRGWGWWGRPGRKWLHRSGISSKMESKSRWSG